MPDMRDLVIENGTLKKYTGNASNLDIPEEIKIIGESAFEGCRSLTHVEIHEGLEEIESYAFRDTGIEEIILPTTLKGMGIMVFAKCHQLRRITVLGNTLRIVNRFASISGPFTNDDRFYNDRFAEVALSPGITTIVPSLFASCCTNSLVLPETINRIEESAFQGCRIPFLTIPDSVTYIGREALNVDREVEFVSIPGSVDEIDKEAFGFFISADEKAPIHLVVRGSKISQSLSKCISKNKEYLEVIFPDMESNKVPVNHRRKMAEYWSEKVIAGESVPADIYKSFTKYIQSHKDDWLSSPAAENESVIRWMIKEKNIGVEDIDALIKLVSDRKMTELLASLMEYQDTMFSMDDYEKQTDKEFRKVQKEIEILSSKDSEVYIRKVWSRKGELVKELKQTEEEVHFPVKIGKDRITGIADHFKFMKDGKEADNIVKHVYLPDSYTYIGSSALENCCENFGIHVADLDQWMNIELYHQDLLKAPYFKAKLLIGDGKNEKITISGKHRVVSDYQFKGISNIREIVIEEGVTSVGSRAFFYCSGLHTIWIPRSLRTIGHLAFNSCVNLHEVHLASIEDWLKAEIGDSPFSGGAALVVNGENITKLVIPNDIERIPKVCFEGCTSIMEVVFPENLREIGWKSFAHCINLDIVTIPEKVQTIGNMAFMDTNPVVVANNLSSYNITAFEIGTLLYTRDDSDLLQGKKDPRYRIRPVSEYDKYGLIDRIRYPLKGMAFALIGKVGLFTDREELTRYIEACGGTFADNITKKTTHVIAEDVDGQTAKHKKAKENGLSIITTQELLALANPTIHQG